MTNTVVAKSSNGDSRADGAQRFVPHRRRRLQLMTVVALFAAMLVGFPGSSGADVTSVSGGATAFLSRVSLFGGPSGDRGPAGTPGCDESQPAPGPNASRTEGCSPTVSLPGTGSNAPVTRTDSDGARAIYGPAALFSGHWIPGDPVAPPSGPMTVSTQGTTGPNGSVTSSASITLAPFGSTFLPLDRNEPKPWVGGVGPGPLVADGVSSTCTARETNAATGATVVTGSTTITNGVLGVRTEDTGPPPVAVRMPANPRPNDGPHRGEITNVGDSFEVYYNEQDTSVPGSITVTAIHMRLLGPIAVGDLYIGQSHCQVHAVPGTSSADPGPTVPGPVTGCTPLTASQLQLLASIDAARTTILRSVPPELRTAMLAQVDAMLARATAGVNRLPSACPPSPA